MGCHLDSDRNQTSWLPHLMPSPILDLAVSHSSHVHWKYLSPLRDLRFQTELSHATIPQNSLCSSVFIAAWLCLANLFGFPLLLCWTQPLTDGQSLQSFTDGVCLGGRQSIQDGSCMEEAWVTLHIYCSLKLLLRKNQREKVSVSSWDNENKAGSMPSLGWLPKYRSLAWASYKQGNEKHMWECKVRSEGLWVSDSRPKTFPLFFSCGLMVSNAILTASISHGGQACFGLRGLFCFCFPCGSSYQEEGNRQGRLYHGCWFFPPIAMGK